MIIFNQKINVVRCEYFKVDHANLHVIRGQSPSETGILKVQGYRTRNRSF